jgi:flagellar hook-length control protein FliK
MCELGIQALQFQVPQTKHNMCEMGIQVLQFQVPQTKHKNV